MNDTPTDSPRRPNVMLLGSSDSHIEPIISSLRPTIDAHSDVVFEDFGHTKSLDEVDADFALVFGGDGSILRSAKQMGSHQTPVLGINLGKLGFLADLSPEEFHRVYADVCQGRYREIEHLMLRCEIHRDGKLLCHQIGLNEVAVLGGPPYSIMEIDLYVDSKWVTTYSCDGLIISTPVGSTAHSLSAGGPILRKDLQAVVISPISPHTLTMRPVVDSADCTYEMRVHRRDGPVHDDETSVVIDGAIVHSVGPDDQILVRRADHCFRMIQVPGQGYYRTLREKLGWGGRLKQLKDR